jgi:hypothetical protein
MRIAARWIVAMAPICFKVIEQPCTAQIPLREDRAVAFSRPVGLIFGVTTSYQLCRLPQLGSSSISVQACAAFAGQDAELATLPGLLAKALRGRHGIGQQLLIQ